MKSILSLLLIVGLISCKHGKEQNLKFNPQAIELNNQALKISHNFKYDSAMNLYDQAIALDTNYYFPHLNKIGIYIGLREYDKAIYESELVIRKKPDLAESWFLAGCLIEYQGDNEKAMKYYLTSIDIFTDRINNPDKQKDIKANKLNRALSKKFAGDESFLKDFDELEKDNEYSFLVDQFKNKSKSEIMDELLK